MTDVAGTAVVTLPLGGPFGGGPLGGVPVVSRQLLHVASLLTVLKLDSPSIVVYGTRTTGLTLFPGFLGLII